MCINWQSVVVTVFLNQEPRVLFHFECETQPMKRVKTEDWGFPGSEITF